MLQESPSVFGTPEEDLYGLVYDELHKIAASRMSRETAFNTLQATALVHEAWLRLGGDSQPQWKSRAYFFASAAEAMRRILIDRARRRNRTRHGGASKRMAIEDFDTVLKNLDGNEQLLLVDDALEALAKVDPRKAELVKLRYFVGLSFDEAARTLGVSESTAKRWWAYARSWLYRQMASP